MNCECCPKLTEFNNFEHVLDRCSSIQICSKLAKKMKPDSLRTCFINLKYHLKFEMTNTLMQL